MKTILASLAGGFALLLTGCIVDDDNDRPAPRTTSTTTSTSEVHRVAPVPAARTTTTVIQ